MRFIFILTVALLVSCSTAVGPPGQESGPGPLETSGYESPSTCVNCHRHQYEQFMESAHASGFSNPVFQAQYFGDVVVRAKNDRTLSDEASRCIACHSPVAHLEGLSPVTHPQQVEEDTAGVTCDFCHTLSGYQGRRPENGNFISRPGPRKLGPFRQTGEWHHVYSEFVTRSEYCAVCHQARNRLGLVIKDTYREWVQSSFSTRNIQCQDCHMNVQGFLEAGKPVYESGKAARGALIDRPERTVLYTHRFPGAHTNSQVEGALALEVRLIGDAIVRGRSASFIVIVDNERTGHKMPTGSADLRVLCLRVSLSGGGWSVDLPAGSRTGDAPHLDILGEGPFDGEGEASEFFPSGSRVYRSILEDSEGRPTLAFYDAAGIVFDNRLEAGEKRLENYSVTIPEELKAGVLKLSAALYYLPYPHRFADQYGAPQPEPVSVATFEKEVPVQ